jgi:hypothetical protein
MAHLSGTNRAQLLLLPEAVDDYVGPDNPVRFIEAFVDGRQVLLIGCGAAGAAIAMEILRRGEELAGG